MLATKTEEISKREKSCLRQQRKNYELVGHLIRFQQDITQFVEEMPSFIDDISCREMINAMNMLVNKIEYCRGRFSRCIAINDTTMLGQNLKPNKLGQNKSSFRSNERQNPKMDCKCPQSLYENEEMEQEPVPSAMGIIVPMEKEKYKTSPSKVTCCAMTIVNARKKSQEEKDLMQSVRWSFQPATDNSIERQVFRTPTEENRLEQSFGVLIKNDTQSGHCDDIIVSEKRNFLKQRYRIIEDYNA